MRYIVIYQDNSKDTIDMPFGTGGKKYINIDGFVYPITEITYPLGQYAHIWLGDMIDAVDATVVQPSKS